MLPVKLVHDGIQLHLRCWEARVSHNEHPEKSRVPFLDNLLHFTLESFDVVEYVKSILN